MESNSTPGFGSIPAQFGFVNGLKDTILPAGVDWKIIGLVVLLTTIFITRIKTELFSKEESLEDGAKRAPMLPYWFPYLGHLPEVVVSVEDLIRRGFQFSAARSSDIFAVKFLGKRHHLVIGPTAIKASSQQNLRELDAERTVWTVEQRVLACPSNQQHARHAAEDDHHDIWTTYLLREQGLSDSLEVLKGRLLNNVTSFVTFNESLVDQMPWERTGYAEPITLPTGDQGVMVNLFVVIRSFVGHTSLPSFFGDALLENHPTFFDNDLWVFDRGMKVLSTGLPRWIPWPNLTTAHIYRKRLHDLFCSWERAFEKAYPPEDGHKPAVDDSRGAMSELDDRWGEFSDVSPLVMAKHRMYQKHGYSIRGRASSDFGLAWGMHANTNVLTFWLIYRIASNPDMLKAIREEIAPYARVIHPPPSGLPIAEPPRLDLDMKGLSDKCPLLKACFHECTRLDGATATIRHVENDVLLPNGRTGSDGKPEMNLLQKGSKVMIHYDLHHKDERYFEDPMAWKPERHLKKETAGEKYNGGTLRPFGGGRTICPGRIFAQREIMAFAAAILSLWDIEPAPGETWKTPKHGYGTAVRNPDRDPRVVVRHRKF